MYRLFVCLLVLAIPFVSFAQEDMSNRVVSYGGLSVELPDGFEVGYLGDFNIELYPLGDDGVEISIVAGEEARFDGDPYTNIDDMYNDFVRLGSAEGFELGSPQEILVGGERAIYVEFTFPGEEGTAGLILTTAEGEVVGAAFFGMSEITASDREVVVGVLETIRFVDPPEGDGMPDTFFDMDFMDDTMDAQQVDTFPPNTVYMARRVEFTYPDNYTLEASQTSINDTAVLMRDDFGAFVTVMHVFSTDDIIEFILPVIAERPVEADEFEVTVRDDGATVRLLDLLSDLPDDAAIGWLYYIVELGTDLTYAIQFQVISLGNIEEAFEEAAQIANTLQLRDMDGMTDGMSGFEPPRMDVVVDGEVLSVPVFEAFCSMDAIMFVSPDEPHAVFECPSNCDNTSGAIWGTDIYSIDSSVCVAAIHAGVLELGEAGSVVVTYVEGQESYEASERNSISSMSWGSYFGSYSLSPVE